MAKRTSKGKFRTWTNEELYDKFLENYNKASAKYTMEDSPDMEEFLEVYNEYKASGAKNVMRTTVSAYRLSDKSIAKQIQQARGEGKLSDYYDLDKYLEPYIGQIKDTVGNRKVTPFETSKNNAYFAFMAELGLIDIADEKYGYTN